MAADGEASLLRPGTFSHLTAALNCLLTVVPLLFPLTRAPLCRDAGKIYAVPQLLQVGAPVHTDGMLEPQKVQDLTRDFVREFRVGTLHIYR